MDSLNLSLTQIHGGIVALMAWAWFFVLAPARSLKAGLAVEAPPLIFKRPGFKLFRFIALAGCVATGLYLAPLEQPIQDYDAAGIVVDLATQGEPPGVIVALVGLLLLLWLLPAFRVGGLKRREEPPGAWVNPALTLFAWGWLGVTLLACVGFWQKFVILDDLLGMPLTLEAGVVLGLGGPLLFALGWGLPTGAILREVREGRIVPAEWIERVRWWGLPAFVAWRRHRRKSPGHGERGAVARLCPSCMRPIEDPMLYESLDFEHCPHCSEVIPPIVGLKDLITEIARQVEAAQALRDQKGRRARGMQRHENDLVQRLLRTLLVMGLHERCTDLHLMHASMQPSTVRGRIDGILLTLLELPEDVGRMLISTVKVQSNLDITERRKPQDGAFKADLETTELDVRVNTSPTPSGETASLRLLYRQRVLGSMDRQGMRHATLRTVSNMIDRPHGMVLVTGPTGSGKSTTLYNCLGALADGQRNIITLEDPIEFEISGLTQMQINPAKNFDFVTGLRSILRQDPDIIMVGEIRDGETAKMAIDAAMTGHLVFSTLHTIDSTATIGRLLDLGVEPHRHAEALLMIMAQRLVRLNCPRCQEDYTLTVDELNRLELPGAPQALSLRRGMGCDHCHRTGFHEREGIYEVLIPDAEVRSLIAQRIDPAKIRTKAREHGMRTLLEDGLTKAVLGRTTIEEVLRVTS